MKILLLSIVICFFYLKISFGQTTIAEQNFDTGNTWSYSSDIAFFDNSWGDGGYFGIIAVSAASPLSSSNFSGNILGENDLDDEGNGTSGFANITFGSLNISKYTNVKISFDYEILGYNSNNDDVNYEIFENGVGQGTVVLFDGAGTPTDEEGSVSISIDDEIGEIYVVLSIRNDGGSGYSGFDNFKVTGTAIGTIPSKLAVTSINNGNSPSVNTAFNVIVQLQDEGNNPTNATQDISVTLSKATGSGTVTGTLTGTILNGTHSITFSGVTYDIAESGVSITATNTEGSVTAGTSSSFSVLAVANQLVFVNIPSKGITNKSLDQFKVEARRSGDNSVDLNYSKSIMVSIATGTGTIAGTTNQTASSGIATFNDITIDAAGDFTLQAIDGSLTSSASGTITITKINIVLNEILADPAPGADSNGDDTSHTSEDEFVELVNTDTTDLDISNWTIYDGVGLKHTFAASTILKPSQAVIIFGGGSPSGTFGDALVFTASSNLLGLNNSGDDVILKDEKGSIILSYTYGSEGGDDQSITRNPDLTGIFTKHETADTNDASSFSPGTKLDGTTFQSSTSLTHSAGYRLLSVPSTETYSNLLDNIWTQGATGADATNGSPNVFTWDKSASGTATGLTDLTGTIPAGEGFLVYVYADDHGDGTPDDFPKTLTASGTEHAVDTSPTINSNPNGWTLLGNPFQSTIAFDSLNRNSVKNVAYVWDANDNSGDGGTDPNGDSGSWKTWNGSTGDLTDGLLAPFQGFFVQTTKKVKNLPSVAFPAGSKVTGGTYYGKTSRSTIPHLRLEVAGAQVSNAAWIQLSESGSATEIVDGDALELHPLATTYAQLGTVKGDKVMDIAHLHHEQEVTIPIEFNTTEGGTFTLQATDFEIPEDIAVIFHDYEQDVSLVVDEAFTYSFEMQQYKKQEVPPLSILTAGAMKVSSTNAQRFGISIRSVSESTGLDEKPLVFGLNQNYPNPFNPSTTISYSIKEAGAVTINVYNLMGQNVATLVDETKAAGHYSVRWNAAGHASGMYYYRLEANGQAITQKMTLIK